MTQYGTFKELLDTEFVHDDECCVFACGDIENNLQLLSACANKEVTEIPGEYEIIDDHCVESVEIETIYTPSIAVLD